MSNRQCQCPEHHYEPYLRIGYYKWCPNKATRTAINGDGEVRHVCVVCDTLHDNVHYWRSNESIVSLLDWVDELPEETECGPFCLA